MSASSQLLIDACMDLENVDFGFCEMAMGIGVVGGECVYISGCGWVVDGIDYRQRDLRISRLHVKLYRRYYWRRYSEC